MNRQPELVPTMTAGNRTNMLMAKSRFAWLNRLQADSLSYIIPQHSQLVATGRMGATTSHNNNSDCMGNLVHAALPGVANGARPADVCATIPNRVAAPLSLFKTSHLPALRQPNEGRHLIPFAPSTSRLPRISKLRIGPQLRTAPVFSGACELGIRHSDLSA